MIDSERGHHVRPGLSQLAGGLSDVPGGENKVCDRIPCTASLNFREIALTPNIYATSALSSTDWSHLTMFVRASGSPSGNPLVTATGRRNRVTFFKQLRSLIPSLGSYQVLCVFDSAGLVFTPLHFLRLATYAFSYHVDGRQLRPPSGAHFWIGSVRLPPLEISQSRIAQRPIRQRNLSAQIQVFHAHECPDSSKHPTSAVPAYGQALRWG